MKLKEVTVEVTQRCNNNCLFCSSNSDRTSSNVKDIPLDKLKEISNFCLSNGVDSINISGGEPLIRNDILDYILFNESLGLKSVIYTSGNVYYDKFFKILNNIKNKELIKFVFNYHSSNEQIFKQLTGYDYFSPIEIEKRFSIIMENGIDIEVHIVPNSINIDYLFDTILYLKYIGIKKVNILRMVLQGRAEKNKFVLVENDFDSKLNKLFNDLSFLSKDDFKIKYGSPFSDVNSCIAGFGKLVFKYNGDVFPCEAFKEAPNKEIYLLGNIYRDKLVDIVNNEQVKKELTYLKTLSEIPFREKCPAQCLYK